MLTLLVYLVILGVAFYLIESIPMSPPFATIVRVLIIVFALVLLLRAFGIVDAPMPQVRW